MGEAAGNELAGALARYAQRVHAAAGSGHHVASPLGAWLLLALAGSAGDPPPEGELAEALGMAPKRAAELARALLDEPHPLVSAASALWHGPRADPAKLAGWRATVPASTEFGPLPDQAAVDRWASEHTYGLIDSFPLAVGPEVLVALAGALATKVKWEHPFDLAPAADLGARSDWASRLSTVLRTPDGSHGAYVATSEHAGPVIVHDASARWTAPDWSAGAALYVVSVAAGADVPPAQVLAAAYELAPFAAGGDRPPGRVSLFDLPLGESELWTLREEWSPDRGGEEQYSAVLPSWSAHSDLDLTAPALGFGAAAEVLAPVVGGERFAAKQAAMARYGRYGFEAAAVSGLAALESMPPQGMTRIAELRFGHPYAVVAIATQHPGPWQHVPVFGAWVTTPEDPSDADLADPPLPDFDEFA